MAWTFRSLPCHSSWWSFVPPRLWFLSFTKRESGWQPAQLDSNARLPQLRKVWKGDFPLGYGIIFIPNISRIPPKIGWCSPSKTNQCVCAIGLLQTDFSWSIMTFPVNMAILGHVQNRSSQTLQPCLYHFSSFRISRAAVLLLDAWDSFRSSEVRFPQFSTAKSPIKCHLQYFGVQFQVGDISP